MQVLPSEKRENPRKNAIENTENSAIPLACDLTVFTDAQRQHHLSATQALFASRLETRELADGYAMRFQFSVETAVALGEFMALEHLCCPFFRLTTEIEPGQDVIWLRLTGNAQVKQFIVAEFSGAGLTLA